MCLLLLCFSCHCCDCGVQCLLLTLHMALIIIVFSLDGLGDMGALMLVVVVVGLYSFVTLVHLS